jgi:Na+/proline symporter
MADFVTIAVVGVYFLLMLGIGVWASKKIKNTEDYLVAGRQLGFWVFILLMIGTVCSGMSLLGVSGLGYKAGWPTIWEQIFVPLSIGICIIFFGVKLHNVAKTAGYVTVQDYLAHRYESPTALRTLSAVAGIIVSLIYLVGQYTAISMVLMWIFGIPLWLALLIATLITMAYTAIGGLYAVAWASLVQAITLIIGVLVMAPIIIWKAGGFTHVNEFIAGVNPNLVMPWNPSGAFAPPYVVSFALLLGLGLACAPHVINNVLAIKDVKYFKWSPLIAFVLYGAVIFLLKFAGFAGLEMVKEGLFILPTTVPNPQDYVILYGIEYAMPIMAVWAIFAVIVLAAVMSTTDRLMLTIGAMFSWDIYKKVLKPDADDASGRLRFCHHDHRDQPARDARHPDLDGHRYHARHIRSPAPCRPVLEGSNPRGSSCQHVPGPYGCTPLRVPQLLQSRYPGCRIRQDTAALLGLCLCYLGPCHDHREPADKEDNNKNPG